jgi:hypothetical protein
VFSVEAKFCRRTNLSRIPSQEHRECTAVLIVAAFQPADFRVERSRTIAAPAAALFHHVNNHRNFSQWNPWQKMDPEAEAIRIARACPILEHGATIADMCRPMAEVQQHSQI